MEATAPLTQEFFTSRGLDAATASRFAAEHNASAGIRASAPEQIPASAPPPASAAPQPPAGMAAADAQMQIDSIRAKRISGEISDYQWRQTYESRVMELAGIASSVKGFQALHGSEQNRVANEWQQDAVQAAFETSIDAAPAARSAEDYVLPKEATMSPEAVALDRTFREALHAAGAPRELGNHLGESFSETARELYSVRDDPQAQAQIVARNEQRLRERWGTGFDANVQSVRSFLRTEGERHPQIKFLVESHNALFESVDSMGYLLTLAQRKARAKA